MMAIGVDRYYAVRKPMVFKLKFSLKRTKLLIVTLWCLALVAALPTALMFQSFYANEEEKSNYVGKSPFACTLSLPFGPWFEDFKAIYLNVVLFFIPVTITGYLFTSIVGYVWQNNKEINVRFSDTSRSVRNSHWTTAKSLLAVFVVFLVCYCPFSIYNLVQRYIPNLLPAIVKNVALLLPYANSCMNPVVYSFTSLRFWRYCARLLLPFIAKTTSNLQHAFASGHSGSQKSDERHDHNVAYVFEPKKYNMDTKADVQQL
ncbi:putative somatostatin receptor type 2-like [Apostichopus japonicus]|uniref:Putative somatostatin receptor type 2-like n=1 Tax=Stichopus japonicus TaxID=307972 RepID=A0A2G8KK34_STIJA|nr:putative somatostatin receptor type 2-like [Apostichopus japonicus]